MNQGLKIINQEKKQSGQVVLILLLVMAVALAIGLSIVQRSLTDISSSTRVEQSSRAFSAAEAGIEKALLEDNPSNTELSLGTDTFGNNATATVIDSGLLPEPLQTLEYPPVSKEEIVHVWLADPNADFTTNIGEYYDQNGLDVYWGTPGEVTSNENRPALELTIVIFTNQSNGTYTSKKILLDPNHTRANNFLKPQQTSSNVEIFECSNTLNPISTIFSKENNGTPEVDRHFYCRARLRALKSDEQSLVLLRARILYSNTSHPVAIKPIVPQGVCATDTKPCSLPPQVKIIQSVGQAGETQRAIQLFKIDKVVPFYFDYAIFSAGDINK